MVEATMQGANLHIRSGWGFSVVLQDTSTHGQEELGSTLPKPLSPSLQMCFWASVGFAGLLILPGEPFAVVWLLWAVVDFLRISVNFGHARCLLVRFVWLKN